MNINFELYRVFYTVANTKNITKAADELMISQPAISKSIKTLETQLGGQLFIRTKRGVILTEEGQEFYNYISQAMEYIFNAEHRFMDLINLNVGTIKIGISATLTKEFLLPYLEIFHKKFPKIDIQIVTNLTSELIPKLKSGLIDIIILNVLNDDLDHDLDVIKCREIQDCFVVNKTYKRLFGKNLSFKDLNNYPLILQNKGSNTRMFLDKITSHYQVVLKPKVELTSYSLVEEFAKIGLGIGYVTKNYVQKELDNQELYMLDIKEKIPKRYIGIATSKMHLPSFSAKKLIEIILNK